MNKMKEKVKKVEKVEYSLEKNKTIKAIDNEKKGKNMEILSYGSLLIYLLRKALG